MLDGNKGVLDNPAIAKRETQVKSEATPEVKKSKGWIFKLILVLIIIGGILYLFAHPDMIREPVNSFFGNFKP